MATQITFNDRINISFPHQLLNSKLNINGSGVNGLYLSNTSPNQLNGSGGGILACLSNIILINLTGNLNVSYDNKNQSIVYFTALLVINISGNDVTLNITNNFAISNNPIKKYRITITDNCSNGVFANNTRYLNIGSFTLNFIINN